MLLLFSTVLAHNTGLRLWSTSCSCCLRRCSKLLPSLLSATFALGLWHFIGVVRLPARLSFAITCQATSRTWRYTAKPHFAKVRLRARFSFAITVKIGWYTANSLNAQVSLQARLSFAITCISTRRT
eukprot:TRINITY_DN39168_c0_g1_i1.p1 TRINITY_DN39168_c0_g1~~TRINITY_DN39168_c0_g1_i1.p1  ORF type:complete len:127 (-),score=8.54 TRINITY_DN39168_c0_g1_i1:145-525(-)